MIEVTTREIETEDETLYGPHEERFRELVPVLQPLASGALFDFLNPIQQEWLLSELEWIFARLDPTAVEKALA